MLEILGNPQNLKDGASNRCTIKEGKISFIIGGYNVTEVWAHFSNYLREAYREELMAEVQELEQDLKRAEIVHGEHRQAKKALKIILDI